MSHATAAPSSPVPGSKEGVSRWVVRTSICGTFLLAVGAFWLSFTSLRELAMTAGIPDDESWIWPLIVDGVIIEATISVVALRNAPSAARRFAWLLLASGAAVSVAANITSAVVAADTAVPGLIAALVASVPPVVLLAMTHLTVELTRNTTPTSTPEPEPETITSAAAVALHKPLPPQRRSTPSLRALSATRGQALQMFEAGISKRQIAARLQVHPTTIGRWLNAPLIQSPNATERDLEHD